MVSSKEMKATIEFTIPEEEEEFRITMRAMMTHVAIHDADEKMRSWVKHGNNFKTIAEAITECRRLLPCNDC